MIGALLSGQARTFNAHGVQGREWAFTSLESARSLAHSFVSALGAAPTESRVPKDQVIKYEAALKADKYVLVVHGNAAEMAKVRSTVEESKLR